MLKLRTILALGILCAGIVPAQGGDVRDYSDEGSEPELVQLTPEERVKAVRALKKVERRSKKLGIALNRGKMEKMKGARIAKVLKEYDRFICILEELPENFVRACKIDTVWFSDEIVDFSGNHAGGVASGEGINMSVGFGKGTVYHEMFHKFERNITESEKREWLDINPEDFIYEGSAWDTFAGNDKQSKKAAERYKKRLAAGKEKTAQEKRDEQRSKKDAAKIAAQKANPEIQAAFINSYAQTTPMEDRAEVFRAMIEEGPRFLIRANASEYMRKKMEFIIRLTGTGRFLGDRFWDVRVEPKRLESETELGYGRIDVASWPKASPEEMGYDGKRLALIPKLIQKTGMGTSGIMVVVGSKVIYEWGDTSETSGITTCWPSLLAMCFGKYVQAGVVDLDETLEMLGVTDVGGLNSREVKATVRDLLTCRSACFHPSASPYAVPAQLDRGSRIPGGHFFYNDWDFNAAASILELKTGKNFIEVMSDDIANSLGFQDWSSGLQRTEGDLSASQHLSYDIRLSTRDMARIGELMLRKGEWKGLQVVPRTWAEQIVKCVSKFPQGGGFGYLWWVENEAQEPKVFSGAFSARGLWGQRITVIPELDMVIAHKSSHGKERPTKSIDYRRLVKLVVTSKPEK